MELQQKIKHCRSRLDRIKGERSGVIKTIRESREGIREKSRERDLHIEALELVKEASLLTQQQLQFHISNIVSRALEAVFPDPYQLKVDFIEKRNKTECELKFVRDGEEIQKPIDSSGGGALDIAALALRITSWVMKRPRTDNVMILDEPLKFLSAEYREAASLIIKELSDQLGLQFIIVTHQDRLRTSADRVFEIKKINKVSKIDFYEGAGGNVPEGEK